MRGRRRLAVRIGVGLALGAVLLSALWWREAHRDRAQAPAEATVAARDGAGEGGLAVLRIRLLPDAGVAADPASVRIGLANVPPDDLAAYHAWERGGRQGAGPGDLHDLAQVTRWTNAPATVLADGSVEVGPLDLPAADRYVLQARAGDGLRFYEARFARGDAPAGLRPRVAAGLRVRAPAAARAGLRAGVLLRRVEGGADETAWQALIRREAPALLDAYDDTALPIDPGDAGEIAVAPLPPGELDVVAVIDGVESERRRVRLSAGRYTDFAFDPGAAELGAALSTTLLLRLVERGSGAPLTAPTVAWASPRGERRFRPDARGVVRIAGIDASAPLSLQALFPPAAASSFLIDALPAWPERVPLAVDLGDAPPATVERTVALAPLRWLQVDVPGVEVPRGPRAGSPFPVFVLQRREAAAWRDAAADAFRPRAGGMAVSLDRDGPVRVAALLAPWRVATSPAVEVRADVSRYRTRIDTTAGRRVVLRLLAGGRPLVGAPVAVIAPLRGAPPLALVADGDGRLVLDGATVPSVRVEVAGYAQAEVRLDRAEVAVALVRDGA